MATKYQTLPQFVLNPFDKATLVTTDRDKKYNTKYIDSKYKNPVKLAAVLSVESSYYYLVKVPSDSSEGDLNYDVVIRFFPPSLEIAKESHLRNYYIQFFSNSPGFMYTYAYVYNKEGFLITNLYDKLNDQFLNTPPKKMNRNKSLSYDKSIYFAVHYLSDEMYKLLDKKHAMAFYGTTSEKKFFDMVSSAKSLSYAREIMKAETDLQKELAKNPNGSGIKNKLAVVTNKILKLNPLAKKTGFKTAKIITAGGKKPKITARRTTRRK